MPSTNAIMGDDNFGTELPQTKPDDAALAEVKKAARFAKSSDFKQLKEHFESRIAFYQLYLPGGTPVVDTTAAERDAMWVAATAIITEFRAVIDAYELAEQSLEA